MSQRLKEFYHPEDYGTEVNVGDNMKLKIGMCLLKVRSIKEKADQKLIPSLNALECMIEGLYSVKEDTKNSFVHGALDT